MSGNKYMRQYMLRRYHTRRQDAIKALGGKCVICGDLENLEFDHKDRGLKGFTIAKGWSIGEERFWQEINKCQLLCKVCHHKKTLIDMGQKDARQTHGTLSSYRYCKCDLCREGKSRWQREYNKRTRSSMVSQQMPFKH